MALDRTAACQPSRYACPIINESMKIIALSGKMVGHVLWSMGSALNTGFLEYALCVSEDQCSMI